MNYFIFPESDSTIYQATGSSNTGLDEILEVTKTMSTSGGNIKVSRILIKFDLTAISASMHNGTITNPKFYLNMCIEIQHRQLLRRSKLVPSGFKLT